MVDTNKRYKENPFLKELSIITKNRQIFFSQTGSEDPPTIFDGDGVPRELIISSNKKVDNEQFIKLYANNLTFALDLNLAGHKAMLVLLYTLRKYINQDCIFLDAAALESFNKKFFKGDKKREISRRVFTNGLIALRHAKLIAPALRRGSYFINPLYVFNGDRVTFVTKITTEKAEEIYVADSKKEKEKILEESPNIDATLYTEDDLLKDLDFKTQMNILINQQKTA